MQYGKWPKIGHHAFWYISLPALLGLTFAGYVSLSSQSPCPIIVYSVASNTFANCNYKELSYP